MSAGGFRDIVTDGLIFQIDAANNLCGNVTNVKNIVNPTEIGSFENISTPPATSVIDNAYSFDGVDDYIDVNNVSGLNGTTNFTIEGWNKKSASGQVVGLNSIIGSNDKILLYWWVNDILYFGVRNGSASPPATYTLAYTDEWYHFVGVYDGSNSLKLYVNSQLVNTQTSIVPSSVSATVGNNMTIGYLNNTNYANGDIGKINIYNKALTQAEITQNYEATKSRYIN